MKILIVDDEVVLAEALRTGLQAEGFTVEVAGSGAEALARASEGGYAAIILDVMLPGLSGYTVCSRLRAGGDWTPVLMLTAKSGEYDEAEGLNSGADDYLRKPFSYVVLLARLRTLLRRTAVRPGSPVLAVGDLEIDGLQRTCRRAGVDIELTAKEFDILSELARQHGAVLSKAEILRRGWDIAYTGGVNVVEVHISSLRRKIDTAFGRRSIETVRGFGYRLVDDGAGADV